MQTNVKSDTKFEKNNDDTPFERVSAGATRLTRSKAVSAVVKYLQVPLALEHQRGFNV